MNEKGKHSTKPAPLAPQRRLFRVMLERVLYVIAESSVEAKGIALRSEPNGAEVKCAEVVTAAPDTIEADEWKGAFVYGTDLDETAEDACKRLNGP